MVCGTNYLGHWKDDRQSYHFSHFGSVWGWASWKRAWAFYDASMSAWGDEKIREQIRDLLDDDEVSRSRLGDSIDSMEIPKIVTRGIFHGVWSDSSTRASPSFPRSTSSPISAISTAEACLRPSPGESGGYPTRISVVYPGAVHVDREYDQLHTRRIFEWSRSNPRLTPKLAVAPRRSTGDSFDDWESSDTASAISPDVKCAPACSSEPNLCGPRGWTTRTPRSVPRAPVS